MLSRRPARGDPAGPRLALAVLSHSQDTACAVSGPAAPASEERKQEPLSVPEEQAPTGWFHTKIKQLERGRAL